MPRSFTGECHDPRRRWIFRTSFRAIALASGRNATFEDLPEWIVTDGTPWEPIDGPLVDPEVIQNRNSLLAMIEFDSLVLKIEQDYNEVARFGDIRILRRIGR